jgi:hypothetical protein
MCGRITVKWILKKQYVQMWNGFSVNIVGFGGGFYEHGYEHCGTNLR